MLRPDLYESPDTEPVDEIDTHRAQECGIVYARPALADNEFDPVDLEYCRSADTFASATSHWPTC